MVGCGAWTNTAMDVCTSHRPTTSRADRQRSRPSEAGGQSYRVTASWMWAGGAEAQELDTRTTRDITTGDFRTGQSTGLVPA